MGDFNQVLNPTEHMTNTNLNFDLKTREFRTCLLEVERFDMVFKGNSFTWWNKSKIMPVAKKLDIIIVNENWCMNFPLAYALFRPSDFSDHAVFEVIFEHPMQKVRKPFRFYNFLL